MTALKAVHINSGIKRGVTAIGPKPPEKPGRWRCTLCPWPSWRDGTYADWMGHYLDHHQGKD